MTRSSSATWRMTMPAISGLLVSLCFPRPGLCFLAWGALAPLLLAVRRGSIRGALLKGWLSGFAFHGLTFYWVFSTCLFAGTPLWVAALAWLSLCGFLGLHWGLTAALGAWLAERRRPLLRPAAWAIVWTASFGAATAFGPRLCADLLEYTQYRHLALLQSASVFGPHGLGFLIVLVNAALAEAWESLETEGLRFNASACFALLLSAWGFGRWQLARRQLSLPSKAVGRVEILQPNVDQYQKWDIHLADRILAGFDELLAAPAPAAPDLIVWPESAVPRWVDEGRTVAEPARWSKTLRAFQLVGVVSKAGPVSHNGAFLIADDGSLRGSYFKRELVPFGEYVPLEFLKRYIGILNQMSGLSAGDLRQPLLETPLGPAGTTICYEAMFPRLSRLDASRGARLIVNITNDGWYKDTWGPYQHFYSNVFRAVENRVTVLRAGNTGISAVIDPWGAVTARLELGKRGRLDAEVSLDEDFPERSFYARHGDWLAAACGAAALLLTVLACAA